MQGENFQINQIVGLAALAVVIAGGYSLAKVCSSGRSNGNSKNPKEEAELLKKFMGFNPELQRGMISYAERMRRGYKKTLLDK